MKNISLDDIFNESSNEYIIDFPINNIIINPQVRRERNEFKIKEIAASIKEHGQITPVEIGYPDNSGKCELHFGFTRYYAQVLNGSETIKAVQREKPKVKTVIQLVENIHREDLNIVDLALSIHSLKSNDGYSAKDICDKLMMSNSKVSKYLGIGSLPEDLLDRVLKLTSDMDTFYFLSVLYKLSSQEAERIVLEGEELGELSRSMVRAASDAIKGRSKAPRTPEPQSEPSNEHGASELQSEPSDEHGAPELQSEPSDEHGAPELQSEPSDERGAPELQSEPSDEHGAPELQSEPSDEHGASEMQSEPSRNNPGLPSWIKDQELENVDCIEGKASTLPAWVKDDVKPIEKENKEQHRHSASVVVSFIDKLELSEEKIIATLVTQLDKTDAKPDDGYAYVLLAEGVKMQIPLEDLTFEKINY